MLRKWMSFVLLGTAILGAALYVRKARATPTSLGFAGATVAVGRLNVQSNVRQPKAHTGWHSLPGHSLIIVTAGTLTNYESSDPDCKPAVYTQGQAFVDHGGDGGGHNIGNDTTAVASSIAIQLISGRCSAPGRRSTAGELSLVPAVLTRGWVC